LSLTIASGVAHDSEDEDAFPLVRCAHIRSPDESRRNSVTCSVEISEDSSKPKSNVPCDIFQKDESGTYLPHHSINFGPQVTRIVLASSFTGLAEWLAWVSGSDAIHSATPRSAVEGSEIRP
jgi:hypothetical protein